MKQKTLFIVAAVTLLLAFAVGAWVYKHFDSISGVARGGRTARTAVNGLSRSWPEMG